MSRRFVFSLLFLVWALLPVQSLHLNAAEPMRLRIATFNVENLTPPGGRGGDLERFRWTAARAEHFERVAAVIEALEPDIINLLEVTSAQSVEYLVDILHEKGLEKYRGYHAESSDGFTSFDVACISKLPLDKIEGKEIQHIYSEEAGDYREAFSYQRDGETVSRDTSLTRNSLYFATINGHKLAFFGLHLKSNPSDDYSNARRVAEAKIVRNVIAKEIKPRGYQPVILGDLNDFDENIPDADDHQDTVTNVLKLLRDYDPETEGEELFNAAEFMPRKADRYTSHWDRNENGVGDPCDVFSMIDHILLPASLKPHVSRAFISHTNDLKTTDHFPVVVDLNLPAK